MVSSRFILACIAMLALVCFTSAVKNSGDSGDISGFTVGLPDFNRGNGVYMGLDGSGSNHQADLVAPKDIEKYYSVLNEFKITRDLSEGRIPTLELNKLGLKPDPEVEKLIEALPTSVIANRNRIPNIKLDASTSETIRQIVNDINPLKTRQIKMRCLSAANAYLKEVSKYEKDLKSVVLNEVISCRQKDLPNPSTPFRLNDLGGHGVKIYLFTLSYRLHGMGRLVTESTAMYKVGKEYFYPYKGAPDLQLFVASVFPNLGLKDAYGYDQYNKAVMKVVRYAAATVNYRSATALNHKVVPKNVDGTSTIRHSFLAVHSDAFLSQRLEAGAEIVGPKEPMPLKPSVDTCLYYKKKAAAGQLKVDGFDYRTDAYVVNTFCACLSVRGEGSEKVRGYLQYDIQRANDAGQTVFTTEDIYTSHVKAYKYAGCECGPAAYWSWLGVTNVPLRLPFDWADPVKSCKLVEISINIMGSCRGCHIGYCPGRFCKHICTPCTEF